MQTCFFGSPKSIAAKSTYVHTILIKRGYIIKQTFNTTGRKKTNNAKIIVFQKLFYIITN
jgi:hypothetical protein